MKRLTIGVLAIYLASILLTGCTIGDTEYVLDLEVVVPQGNHVFAINGSKCTQEEAKLYLCNYQNLYGSEYGMNLWEHDFGAMHEDETLEAYVKDITLSQLANIICMNLLADNKEITLTDVEQRMVGVAAEEYYKSLSQAELDYMGIDLELLKDCYERYAIAEKLYATLTQGVNEEVSDDEARVIRVQQIYVSKQETALEVQKKLAEGDDFASVASNYNEADTIETTIKRGDYPYEVDLEAFNLDNGQQSGMIATSNGYYFIKCLNKFERDLTEQNKLSIIAQRQKQQFDDVFHAFIVASEFELNEEIWDDIDPDTTGVISTDSFFEVYDKYFN